MAFSRDGLCRIGGSGVGGATWHVFYMLMLLLLIQGADTLTTSHAAKDSN